MGGHYSVVKLAGTMPTAMAFVMVIWEPDTPSKGAGHCRGAKKIINEHKLGSKGHPFAGVNNSQIIGSKILVYTIRDKPQSFTHRWPSRRDYLR